MKLAPAAERALDLALEFTGTHHGASRWGEYRRCPRAHHLRYVEGLRTKRLLNGFDVREGPDYFVLGNVLHSSLAYAAMGVIEGFDWDLSTLWDAMEERKLFDATPEQREAFAEGKRLVHCYFKKWGPDNAGYGPGVEVLEVEHFVRSRKLIEPYTGRADVLLDVEGKLIIGDHKTRANMPRDDDEVLARFWRTKPQFLGLAFCVREIEGETPGFLVNVISKTTIPDFRRVMWFYTDEELDRWADEHDDSLRRGLDQKWMNYRECAPDIGAKCWAFAWCHGTDEEREKLYQIGKQQKKRKDGKDGKGYVSYPGG